MLTTPHDERSPIRQAAMFVIAPIFVVVLMPFVMILIVAVYVIATLEGTRMAYQTATGTTPDADLELPRPHFLELQAHRMQNEISDAAR